MHLRRNRWTLEIIYLSSENVYTLKWENSIETRAHKYFIFVSVYSLKTSHTSREPRWNSIPRSSNKLNSPSSIFSQLQTDISLLSQQPCFHCIIISLLFPRCRQSLDFNLHRFLKRPGMFKPIVGKWEFVEILLTGFHHVWFLSQCIVIY